MYPPAATRMSKTNVRAITRNGREHAPHVEHLPRTRTALRAERRLHPRPQRDCAAVPLYPDGVGVAVATAATATTVGDARRKNVAQPRPVRVSTKLDRSYKASSSSTARDPDRRPGVNGTFVMSVSHED